MQSRLALRLRMIRLAWPLKSLDYRREPPCLNLGSPFSSLFGDKVPTNLLKMTLNSLCGPDRPRTLEPPASASQVTWIVDMHHLVQYSTPVFACV